MPNHGLLHTAGFGPAAVVELSGDDDGVAMLWFEFLVFELDPKTVGGQRTRPWGKLLIFHR